MSEPIHAVREAFEIVQGRIEDIRSQETTIHASMGTALQAIGAVDLPSIGGAPTIPSPTFTPPDSSVVTVPSWSDRSGDDRSKCDGAGERLADKAQSIYDSLDLLGLLGDLPEAPDRPDLILPTAPVMAVLTAPADPNISTEVTIPEAPTIVDPELPELVDLQIPDFTFPDMPDFDGKPPEIDFAVPTPSLAWVEPVYASENLTLLSAEIKRMMGGGTGLPAPIEQALFGRARDRQAQEAGRAVQDVVDTYASRNFSMPPGMLAKSVAVAREKEGLEAAQLNRDILVEAAKWEIENLRFVVTQGMALEQLLANIFENMAKRGFEAAKFVAEAQISLFNAHISLFNAQNQAFQTLATVFKTRLEVVLAKVQVYKTQIEAEVAKGQINQQRVEVYKAMVQAVLLGVEVYKAKMQGAQVHADVIKNQFDGYRTQVMAFGEQVQAEKAKFEVYEAQIKGEVAKAQMFEAQTRGYAAAVTAMSSKAEVAAKKAGLGIEAVRAAIQGTMADVECRKVEADIIVARLRGKVEAFRGEVEAYVAGERASASWAEVQSRYADFASRTAIAYGQAQMSAYGTKTTAAIEASKISLEKAKSVGQFTAQMAAGLMSAINISAGVTGSGSQANNYSETKSEGKSTNYNYSYG